MATAEVVQLDPAQRLRPAEQAWLYTCERHETRRRAGGRDEIDAVRARTLAAVDACQARRVITSKHMLVMVVSGTRGSPPHPSLEAARALWDEAMNELEQELSRAGVMFFPPNRAPASQAAMR